MANTIGPRVRPGGDIHKTKRCFGIPLFPRVSSDLMKRMRDAPFGLIYGITWGAFSAASTTIALKVPAVTAALTSTAGIAMSASIGNIGFLCGGAYALKKFNSANREYHHIKQQIVAQGDVNDPAALKNQLRRSRKKQLLWGALFMAATTGAGLFNGGILGAGIGAGVGGAIGAVAGASTLYLVSRRNSKWAEADNQRMTNHDNGGQTAEEDMSPENENLNKLKGIEDDLYKLPNHLNFKLTKEYNIIYEDLKKTKSMTPEINKNFADKIDKLKKRVEQEPILENIEKIINKTNLISPNKEGDFLSFIKDEKRDTSKLNSLNQTLNEYLESRNKK